MIDAAIARSVARLSTRHCQGRRFAAAKAILHPGACIAVLLMTSGCGVFSASDAPVVPSAGEQGSADRMADASAGPEIEQSTRPLVGEVAEDFPRSRIVALDFVDAMNSLPELIPTETTLFTRLPDTRFAEILVSALQNSGYRLRLGEGAAEQSLDYLVRSAPRAGDANSTYDANSAGAVTESAGAGNEGEFDYTFEVMAGRVHLKRVYRVDATGIVPASAMKMRTVAVNEQTLGAGPAAALTSPPADMNSRPKGESRTRNMYDSGESQYADILAEYTDVSRDVMVFPNDSLLMGKDNKRMARDIVDRFDAERDVISVIGCSHGRTALPDGNRTLALGRASRVREEFELAGIDAGRVLDEGCWAGQYFDPMPRRGVVVTHKRRVDQ